MQKKNLAALYSRQHFLLLILTCLIFIAIGFHRVEGKLPPVNGLNAILNDQVGYLSGAKSFIERGVIESCCIYPSTLSQNTQKFYLYTPMTYIFMALPFFLIEFNDLNFLLVNSVYYLLTALMLWLCGNKLYGKKPAFLSSLLFASFPFVLLFTFSAMAELNILFISVFSLWVTTCLSSSKLRWLGIFLVVLPFAFRETSALVLFPYLGVLFSTELKSKKWGPPLLFTFLSALFCLFLLLGPLSDRPSLLKANIFGTFEDLYSNALFHTNSHFSAIEWLKKIGTRLIANFYFILRSMELSSDLVFLKLFLLLTPLSFVLGLKNKDSLAVGTGLMSSFLWLLLNGLYSPTAMRGIRVLLILLPFFCLTFGKHLTRWKPVYLVPLMASLITLNLSSFVALTKSFSLARQMDQKIIQEINLINPNRNHVIVAPYQLALPWIKENYPARWSFIPANLETLQMLDRGFPVDTMILDSASVERLGLNNLSELGWYFSDMKTFFYLNLMVFEKR